MQNFPPPPPPQQFNPNLNLSPPPPFSGSHLHLPTFKIKLFHSLVGNRHTYPDSESQLLYAGQLLEGPAYQWYQAIVDLVTTLLPPASDLARFFQELEDFFGGAVTLHSRERSLSRKLKESVRFELTARGSPPPTFHAYVAAAISVEQNQAAATSSRS